MSRNKIPIDNVSAEQTYAKHRRRWYRHRCRCSWMRVGSKILLAAAIMILISAAIMPAVRVVGGSMEPALKKDEKLLLLRSAHPQRGEIWAFSMEERILLRRVIGLAGDEVDLDERGNVWVNGQLLKKTGKHMNPVNGCDVEFPCTVPEDAVFVLGEDREHALDSRSHAVGFVPQNKLMGKVVFRIWPHERIGVPK